MKFPVSCRLAVTLVAVLVLGLTVAAPAFGQQSRGGTSVVTQADCDAGRITNRQGRTLRGEECRRLVGKRVRLAQTGFEAWILGLAGLGLAGGAVALRFRRRRMGAQLA